MKSKIPPPSQSHLVPTSWGNYGDLLLSWEVDLELYFVSYDANLVMDYFSESQQAFNLKCH